MQLTKAEEQRMGFIWQEEKVFLKDLINLYPEPKPPATLLKRTE
ncbi:MAG: hypothetical protein QM669_11930 [Siphonobacter sp.]